MTEKCIEFVNDVETILFKASCFITIATIHVHDSIAFYTVDTH